MHALVIEDEALIALYLETVLRDLGFTSVMRAATEEQAVTAASARCPDLITADIRLAPGSGISAVRRICERQPVPVVFVTGNPEDLRQPAAIVVAKPFTEAELTQAVATAIGRIRPA